MIEHPYERSSPLQFIMVMTFIMTIIFLGIDHWAEAPVAALMSFAWFLVSFTLYMVAWLLHGHARWQGVRDGVNGAAVDEAG